MRGSQRQRERERSQEACLPVRLAVATALVVRSVQGDQDPGVDAQLFHAARDLKPSFETHRDFGCTV